MAKKRTKNGPLQWILKSNAPLRYFNVTKGRAYDQSDFFVQLVELEARNGGGGLAFHGKNKRLESLVKVKFLRD